MDPVKPPPRRTYGGRTAEQRARGRRSELIGAAFAIVAEHGWGALNAEAVCRRAGLNKRYFYEAFAGLDPLSEALIDALTGEAVAVTLAAIEDESDPGRAIAIGVATFVEHLTDDPRRARVLFGAVPAADGAAGYRAAATRRVIATVADRGRAILELDDHPAIDLTAALLTGGTSQAVLSWLDGTVRCPREQLVKELIGLWQAIGDAVGRRVPRRPRCGP